MLLYLQILRKLEKKQNELHKTRSHINPYKAGSDDKIRNIDRQLEINEKLIKQLVIIIDPFMAAQSRTTKKAIKDYYYKVKDWSKIYSENEPDLSDSTLPQRIRRAADDWQF